jgi:hypothetical protein
MAPTLGATAPNGNNNDPISERNMSEAEFARLQEIEKLRAEWAAEKKRSPEEIAREQAEQERRHAEYEATQKLRLELEIAENKEREKQLRELRAKLMSTEAGRIQSREALEISEERLQEARTPIRVELARRAGVLGNGDPSGPMSEDFVGQEVVGVGKQKLTAEFDLASSENALDRAEPMSTGLSLAELQRRMTAEKPSSPTASRPPRIDAAPASGRQLEEAVQRLSSLGQEAEALSQRSPSVPQRQEAAPAAPALSAQQRRQEALRNLAKLQADADAKRAQRAAASNNDDKKTGAL